MTAAIESSSFGINTSSSATSVSVDWPTGVAEGKRLVAQFSTGSGNAKDLQAPAGFVPLFDEQSFGATAGTSFRAWVKELTDDEPSSGEFTCAEGSGRLLVRLSLLTSDVGDLDVVGAVESKEGDRNTSDPHIASAPGVTTTVDDALLLSMWFFDYPYLTGHAPLEHPVSMEHEGLVGTQAQWSSEGNTRCANSIAYEVLGAAGATGVRDWTVYDELHSAHPTSYVVNLAFQPGSAPAPTKGIRLTGIEDTTGTAAPDATDYRYSVKLDDQDTANVVQGTDGEIASGVFTLEVPNQEVAAESLGSTDGSGDASGTLDHPPQPGTVEITVDTETIADDGEGALTGDASASGTINYETGAWTLTGAAVSEAITADYEWRPDEWFLTLANNVGDFVAAAYVTDSGDITETASTNSRAA